MVNDPLAEVMLAGLDSNTKLDRDSFKEVDLQRRGSSQMPGKDKEPAEKDEETKMRAVGFGEIFSYFRPKVLIVLSPLMSLVNGIGFPAFGLIFTKLLFILMQSQLPSFEEDRNLFCLLFLALVVYMMIFGTIQKIFYTVGGENLTFTFRSLLFENILYKNIAWFDKSKNSPGVLTNVLSQDILALNGLTTESFSVILECILTLAVSIIASMLLSWQVALVALVVSPLTMLGTIFSTKYFNKNAV